jgi:hypothetical protein
LPVWIEIVKNSPRTDSVHADPDRASVQAAGHICSLGGYFRYRLVECDGCPVLQRATLSPDEIHRASARVTRPPKTVIILVMPFTISHAAAAYPFRRTPLITSALIIGCFAPDFEYFIPFEHHGTFGHTLLGVFALDLPLSLAVLWLFHRYAKEPLAACLPASARARLQLGPGTLSIKSPAHFALIVFSILIGVATHIFWDSLTHSGHWLGHHVPFLDGQVTLPIFGPRPWFGILQYFSSAIGIVILMLWAFHWYRYATPVASKNNRNLLGDRIALACSFLIALLAALVRGAATGLPNGVHGAQHFMTIGAITGIAVFCFEIVIYGIVRNHARNIVNPA